MSVIFFLMPKMIKNDAREVTGYLRSLEQSRNEAAVYSLYTKIIISYTIQNKHRIFLD